MTARCRRHHRLRSLRSAFTAIELLVLLAIVLVLAAIFVPYLLRTRESAHRTECADHLRAIGIALNSYAGQHDGLYPCVVYDRARRPRGYMAFSGADSADPFAPGGAVQANDVTASLWLLVREGYITDLNLFICPSTSDFADALVDLSGRPVGAGQRGNFRSGRNLSYSYCSPFSDAPGFHLNDVQADALAVMADRNPGVRAGQSDVAGPGRWASAFELARANSFHHGRAGQNVLYRNGVVLFQWTPYCGLGWDNIYTAMAPEPVATTRPALDVNGVVGPQYGPAWVTDSYLVPTAQENALADFPKPPTSAATAATSQAATLPVTTTRAVETTLPATSEPAATRATGAE